jgi:NAD(P)H dehydrogenase (quinone)
MIAVTGASGHLGRHVLQELMKTVPAGELIAMARTPSKLDDLSAQGVQVRQADYNDPDTLAPAMDGASHLLMISASEVGKRKAQHRTLLDAAKLATVSFVTYTSLLHADSSPLEVLASEHRATEEMLRRSGLPHCILRNGWYFENYTGNVKTALDNGAFIGCAGNGRISAATREDFAAAAAAVVTTGDHEGQIYELAGDEAFTMQELAAEVSRQAGKTIGYSDMPAEAYRSTLTDAGLPEPLVNMLVSSDEGIAQGGLFDESKTLSKLIGRPTTSLADAVARGLEALRT